MNDYNVGKFVVEPLAKEVLNCACDIGYNINDSVN